MIRRAPLVLFVVASLGAFACVTTKVTTERRPDGIYHLKCKTSLHVCLAEADALCEHHRYAVLRAFDTEDFKGDTAMPEAFSSSEAFIRCGGHDTWGNENSDLMKAPLCEAPPAKPPAPVAAATGCTPGLSQACVGTAGCKGGQSCAPDGRGFGPCDCGAVPVAPAP